MLWIKSLHVFAVMGWMAGVFYTPRLLVNYAEALKAGEAVQRLRDMGRRLYRFTSGLALIAVVCGLVLWLGYGDGGRWLDYKLVFVLGLLIYHFVCGRYVRRMQTAPLGRGPLFFRILNEVSVLLVLPIVALAVIKPS